MILSAQTIARTGLVKPFVEKQKTFVYVGKPISYGLGPACYDIRVTEDIPEFSTYINPASLGRFPTLETISLPPGVLGTIHSKLTLCRVGLTVENTVIPPGWSGTLEIGVFNREGYSIPIKPGMPIAQIVFHRLDEATNAPYGIN